MTSSANEIPSELLNTSHYPEDVSILIGENGSGKSTLLNYLSKYFINHGKNVIALANSIHDKFDTRHENFKVLRGRSGRRQTRSTIKKALENIGESDIQRLKNASTALKYIGFNPTIGFKIEGLNPDYRNIIITSDSLNNEEKEELFYLINKAHLESMNYETIWLEVEYYNYKEVEKSYLTRLFQWESKLKSLNIISRIEVFLHRELNAISMLEASSGELSLITSMVYLSTAITENTVILIDEPENSLHPRWQKEYTKILLDLFYLFQPKIIIATHSPLVVSGTELFSKNPKIYKAENFLFHLQKKEPLNVEELLFRFFDINTPHNRFLSDRIVRLLNLLSNNKISFAEFEIEIKKIVVNSYDPTQINVLNSVIELASEI